jgi:hypothetical protein
MTSVNFLLVACCYQEERRRSSGKEGKELFYLAQHGTVMAVDVKNRLYVPNGHLQTALSASARGIRLPGQT